MGHREDLLVGAVRCLREKGYAHTTARDIVAASGTNLASIGYHYGSTKALLNAAVITAMEDFGAEMAKAIGRAVGRSVKVVPTPTWLFMKAARMSGYPIDLFSGIRYYIDDHKRGAFELGAPTTDVPDVTGRPAEDFETISRRYAALPRNQRTFGNWLREFVQFMLAPLTPGFDFDRYDRELRRPFPSAPQFATDSKVWQREHAIAEIAKSGALGHDKSTSAIAGRTQRLEF